MTRLNSACGSGGYAARTETTWPTSCEVCYGLADQMSTRVVAATHRRIRLLLRWLLLLRSPPSSFLPFGHA